MAVVPVPKNIVELRHGLMEVFANVQCGSLRVPLAKEANNAAGKAINTLRVQLEACALAKSEPNIAFLREGKAD